MSITFFQLTLLHGLVDPNVTPDLPSYCNIFNRICKYGFLNLTNDNLIQSKGTEYGFLLWTWIVSLFTNNKHVYLVITSALLLNCFYISFKKLSPYVWFSILLLLLVNFNQSLFVLRQHLSIAILTLSYPFIIKRDIKKFMLFFTIAYLFHKSSLIFFPVYFLYGISNTKKYLIIMTICSALFIVVVPLVRVWGFYFTRNEFFIENMVTGMAVKALIMGAIMVMYIFFLGKDALKIGINKLVFTLSLLGIVGNAIVGEAGEGRIFWCYYIVVLFQIPIILKNISDGLIKAVFVIGTLAIYFVWAYFLAGDVIYWSNFRLIM